MSEHPLLEASGGGWIVSGQAPGRAVHAERADTRHRMGPRCPRRCRGALGAQGPAGPEGAELPDVNWQEVSALALAPRGVGSVDWWCSDIVAFPDRLLDLVTRWLASGRVRNSCTQSSSRVSPILPNARVFHLDQTSAS
jgi:hypothetical protein